MFQNDTNKKPGLWSEFAERYETTWFFVLYHLQQFQ